MQHLKGLDEKHRSRLTSRTVRGYSSSLEENLYLNADNICRCSDRCGASTDICSHRQRPRERGEIHTVSERQTPDDRYHRKGLHGQQCYLCCCDRAAGHTRADRSDSIHDRNDCCSRDTGNIMEVCSRAAEKSGLQDTASPPSQCRQHLQMLRSVWRFHRYLFPSPANRAAVVTRSRSGSRNTMGSSCLTTIC